MTLHTALLALAAGGFVLIFSALVVTAVVVLFGGRGAPDQPGNGEGDDEPASNPYEYPGWPPS